MARPLFILGFESSSVDRVTGLPSYFHVFDSMDITLKPMTPADGPQRTHSDILKVSLAAAWMRDDLDLDTDVFEHQLRIFSTENEVRVVSESEFEFTANSHRFDVQIGLGTLFNDSTKSGIVRVESRIRKRGDELWISQEYPIRVNFTQAAIDNGK